MRINPLFQNKSDAKIYIYFFCFEFCRQMRTFVRASSNLLFLLIQEIKRKTIKEESRQF